MEDVVLIAQYMQSSVWGFTTGKTNILRKLFKPEELSNVPKRYTLQNPYKTWNELMPVIEKISDHAFEVEIEGERVDTAYPRTFGMLSVDGNPMFRFNRFSLFERKRLIDAAYAAVLEFIKWYNQNNMSHEPTRL